MTGTLLEQQLNEESARRPSPIDALKLARRQFLAGERIEMHQLAADLGISRVTLHRWVGSRDLLLAEIHWSLAAPAFDRARQSVRANGPQAVAATIENLLTDILSDACFRDFLTREPEIALRVLTTTRTPFQGRMVERTRQLISDELGSRTLPLPEHDLAYLVTRIAETFCYLDLIQGGEPDPGKAAQAIAALLR